MSAIWFKRGIGHKLGNDKIGGPAYILASPTSYLNRKLADNHTIVVDSNNYAQKVANQAQYTPSTTPAGAYPAPFEISINTSNFATPMWVMPSGYPTRKVVFVASNGSNSISTGDFTLGSNQVTNVVANGIIFSNGEKIWCENILPDNTTIVSGAGTSTWTLSNNAIASGTSQKIIWSFSNTWVFNLQGDANNTPIPQTADLPSGWMTQWSHLEAGGSDKACSFYQPSTDMMWEYYDFRGNETTGYFAMWGAVVHNVSQNDGTLPNTTGVKASSLLADGGVMMSQEVLDNYIPHALNVALPVTAPLHLAPATRNDSSSTLPGGEMTDAVPEGAIFRLPANVTIDPTWSPFLRMIVKAIRDYGFFITDTSGAWQLDGEDPRTIGTMFNPRAINGSYLKNIDYHTDLFYHFPWSQLQQVAYP